jgi:hypothetical protein
MGRQKKYKWNGLEILDYYFDVCFHLKCWNLEKKGENSFDCTTRKNTTRFISFFVVVVTCSLIYRSRSVTAQYRNNIVIYSIKFPCCCCCCLCYFFFIDILLCVFSSFFLFLGRYDHHNIRSHPYNARLYYANKRRQYWASWFRCVFLLSSSFCVCCCFLRDCVLTITQRKE